MADGFHLADFGEIRDFLAHVFGAQRFHSVHRGTIEFWELVGFLARRTALEEERFILREVLGDFLDHACTSASASISARLVVSVAQSSTESASSG